jgi:hypothetical protein
MVVVLSSMGGKMLKVGVSSIVCSPHQVSLLLLLLMVLLLIRVVVGAVVVVVVVVVRPSL